MVAKTERTSRHVEDKMNLAENEFKKAIKYLDYGKMEQGERCLRQAIEAAEAGGEQTIYIRAAICYGDVLWETERFEEAERWLTIALERYAILQSETDVLDMEVSRAKELIERMAKK